LVEVFDGRHHNDLSEHLRKIYKSLRSGDPRIDLKCNGGSASQQPRSSPMRAKAKGYYSPPDNPFVNVPSAHGEFWSVEFRSPFRMKSNSITRLDGIGEDDLSSLCFCNEATEVRCNSTSLCVCKLETHVTVLGLRFPARTWPTCGHNILSGFLLTTGCQLLELVQVQVSDSFRAGG
jgi:hypothetical protein